MSDLTPAPRRAWATSSLIAGVVWMILAVSPTFLTTLLGLPFAGYALVVGWLSRRHSRRAGDHAGVRRAGWGVGLGCAGFVYLTLFYFVAGSLIVTAVWTAANAFFQGTPQP
jgi:hypothetical protein